MTIRTIPQLIGILIFLALVVAGASRYTAEERSGELHAWFCDVGQGDAILLDTPERQQVLVDGGPDSSVLTCLTKALPLTDKDLDLVVVTHNHADHLRGVVEVLKHYQVKQLWISGAIHTTDTYREFLELAKAKSIPTTVVVAGQTARYGLLEGIVIYPFVEQRGESPENQHDATVVTYWTYGSQSLLLTGDAEMEHEEEMLQQNVLRPTTILKVGHHGSRTSSGEAFLNRTTPKIAVIQVGRRNRFGHPVPETLQRLESLAIPVLRNDNDGTIRFSIWPDRYSWHTGL